VYQKPHLAMILLSLGKILCRCTGIPCSAKIISCIVE
jgi:hypothetical protein